MPMAPVGTGNVVFLLKCCAYPCGYGLLSNVEVDEARYLARSEKFCYLLRERIQAAYGAMEKI